MIKTEFMEMLEELDTLYEADINASKKFWSAAKNKQIDKEAFHTAFDTELTELGLMRVFDDYGRLTGRGTYGSIKKANEANPDSWAVKALLKLWTLAYSDGVAFPMTPEELAAKAAKDEEHQREEEEKAKRWEQEKAARKKQIEADCAQAIQDFKDTVPEAIKLVDKELHDKYMSQFNLTDADVDVEIGYEIDNYHYYLRSIKILPNNSGVSWTLYASDIKHRTDPAKIAKFLEADFKHCLNKVKKEAEKALLRKRREINSNAIDLLKKYPSAIVILLGESGTAYFIDDTHSLLNTKSSETVVGSVDEITEPYKVIYTRTGYADSSNNNSTYHDNVYYHYHSWDSSEEDRLKEYLPEIGRSPQGWGYSETEKTSGEGSRYSKMDNIDSWAYEKYTSLATD